MRIGSYVAFGVGAVGLGLGTYFVIDMSKKRSEADDLCTLPGGKCDPAVRDDVNDLDSQANSAGTKSVIGFAVGGIGIVTGITLLALSGGSSNDAAAKAPARPYVAPFVGRNTIGVKGAF
jgi:NADH:ubiquinone oxidoreductase subunit 5 (subunit L)/multisubunit Na+/H+ antiporter MnhA subunit